MGLREDDLAYETMVEGTDESIGFDEETESIGSEEELVTEEPPKKKRGRPKKEVSPEDEVQKEPKKRGRKPKSKEQPPEESEPDEKYNTLLSLVSECKKEFAEIAISDIVIPELKAQSREITLGGLKQSIEQCGVTTPITVFEVMEYDEEAEEELPQYYLLDGYRRLTAMKNLGIEKAECFCWSLEEYDLAENHDLFLIVLSSVIQKTQKNTSSEYYALTSYLEEQGLKPESVEDMLNLPSGSVLQLKDVMTSEEHDEIKQKLVDGDLEIEGAYKKLNSARKKAEKEKLKAEQEEAGIISEEETGKKKGKKGKKEDEDTPLQSTGDEECLSAVVSGPANVQSTKHRTFIDPKIKEATFKRDNFICQGCYEGRDEETDQIDTIFTTTFIYHHKIPVYCGGEDSVSNGVTLCVNCHKILHQYEFGLMPEFNSMIEDFSPKKKARYQRIQAIADVAIQKALELGKTKKEIKDHARLGMQDPFPTDNTIENETMAEEQKAKEQEGVIAENTLGEDDEGRNVEEDFSWTTVNAGGTDTPVDFADDDDDIYVDDDEDF